LAEEKHLFKLDGAGTEDNEGRGEDSWISSPSSSVDERYWAGRSRERLTITVPVPLMCLTELREALLSVVKGTLLNGNIFILHLSCAFSEMLALHLGVRRSTRS
jgi:hypothetical protein